MTGLSGEEWAAAGAAADLHDARFLTELRGQMLRFATLQLGHADQAEDAVQDALIGAMKNAGAFAGQAALKTWVFAILKHKIADSLRQRQRLAERLSEAPADDADDSADSWFDRSGHWQADQRPQSWADPEAAVHSQDFWRVFEACLAHLPAQQARVFMMREFVELDSAEICAVVGISVSNLNVILHRARLRLRGCLEKSWFAEGACAC